MARPLKTFRPAPDAERLFHDYANAPTRVLMAAEYLPEELPEQLRSFPDVRMYLHKIFHEHGYSREDLDNRLMEIKTKHPEIHQIASLAERVRELGKEDRPSPETATRLMNDIVTILTDSWKKSATLIG